MVEDFAIINFSESLKEILEHNVCNTINYCAQLCLLKLSKNISNCYEIFSAKKITKQYAKKILCHKPRF